MKNWFRPSILMAALFTCVAASTPRLVPDVSQRDIEIRYSFTGAELLLFGAIVYPDGKTPEKAPDIIVVLKGPEQAIEMREKNKVAGMWVNTDSIRFHSAPSFYAIASSRPVAAMTDARTAAIYELGIDNIQLSPSAFRSPDEIKRFEVGLIDLQTRKGLFVQRYGSVEITDKILYRARLPLSARALVGDYTAETFLVQDGRVVAAAIRDIHVRKSGFESFVAIAAESWSFFYGLAAIAVALFMGWLANFIGRKL
jgi:uncharacterized protein (TIGR02186 family)